MLRLPLAIACAVLCVSCGPTDRSAPVTTAVDEGGSMMKNAQREASANSRLAIPGDSVDSMLQSGHVVSREERIAEEQAEAQRALALEGERMRKQTAAQIAAQQRQRAQRSQASVVVPAQDPLLKTTSEIEEEKRAAARAAKIAARKQYCEEHPVECETLRAAQQAQSDLEALKTSLWMQGSRP